jgi:hypothetical protein
MNFKSLEFEEIKIESSLYLTTNSRLNESLYCHILSLYTKLGVHHDNEHGVYK